LAKECSSRYDSISGWCTLNAWLSIALAVIYAMSINVQCHKVQEVVAHIYHTEIKNEPSPEACILPLIIALKYKWAS
jgi:hypothetical protein